MTKLQALRLPAEKLTVRHDPGLLDFETTEELAPTDEIIGQDRALNALRLGLEIKGRGFNVFVCGLAGSGRTTTIKKALDEMVAERTVPDDICYVNNFDDPRRPKRLRLPGGMGRVLVREMDSFVNHLERTIPQVLESEEFSEKIKDVKNAFQEQSNQTLRALEAEVSGAGFTIASINLGPVTQTTVLPVIDGEPAPMEKLEALAAKGSFDAEKLAELKEKHGELATKLEAAMKQSKKLTQSLMTEVGELRRKTLEPVIRDALSGFAPDFNYPVVQTWFEEVVEDLLSSLDLVEEEGDNSGPAHPMAEPQDPMRPYRVNLLVDNASFAGAPVVVENSPTFKNLFGTIERITLKRTDPPPDFMDIRAGSLLQANGGFLVLNAHDVMNEAGSWTYLKRALRNGCWEIQSYEALHPFQHSSLKPEPIKLDLRVIIAGDSELYRFLYEMDEDFSKVFKIKADFDSVIERAPEHLERYARFIAKIIKKEELPPFNRGAVGLIIDRATRIAGNQKKLSTMFSQLSDLIVEAAHWAAKDEANPVTRDHVEKAIRERRYRGSLIEEKMQEMFEDKSLLIDVQGLSVGQVNGLTVFEIADQVFSKPVKITATCGVGKAGIINIEREVELSGRTHDKGVLILHGFLRNRYAQTWPLTLSASICFEQSYSGVDGDSASSSELYALLSSIGSIPVRQDIAITGSVNQKGEIQPIGGVNEKIEGFFKVCSIEGLTGQQGVMIPWQNEHNLLLDDEVVEAVRTGMFHIYSIRSVDEGIAILTGLESGEPDEAGNFPPDSVHGIVMSRLRELAEKHRTYESFEPDSGDEEEEG